MTRRQSVRTVAAAAALRASERRVLRAAMAWVRLPPEGAMACAMRVLAAAAEHESILARQLERLTSGRRGRR